MLYSATYNDDVLEKVHNIIGSFKPFPVKKEALQLKGVQNFRIPIKETNKADLVLKVHTNLEKTMSMIFVNKRRQAEELKMKMEAQGVKATILIGGMETKQRDLIIDSFRKGCFTCLISTNVLARGIDVPEVDLVINYDVPTSVKFDF